MPRVSCPECDKVVKVPVDYERSCIRCPSCEFKIRLDEEEEDSRSSRNGRGGRSTAKERVFEKKKKKSRNEPSALWFLPLLMALGLLALFALAPFNLYAARVAMVLGLAAALAGAIMAYVVAKRYKMSTDEDAAWYLRGGGALLFYQIKNCIDRPKDVGPWVLLEILGMVVTIACGVMIEKRMAAPNVPPPQQQAVNPPPNNNPPPNFNPPPKDPPRFDGQPKVEPPPAAVKVTGDAMLDKALTDLASKDFFARQKAAEYMVSRQPDQNRAAVVQYLVTLTKNPDPPIRNEAIRILTMWGGDNRGAGVHRALGRQRHQYAQRRSPEHRQVPRRTHRSPRASLLPRFSNPDQRDQGAQGHGPGRRKGSADAAAESGIEHPGRWHPLAQGHRHPAKRSGPASVCGRQQSLHEDTCPGSLESDCRARREMTVAALSIPRRLGK